MKTTTPVSVMVVALFAFVLAGCGENSTEPTGSSTPVAEGGHGDHEDGDHEDGDHKDGDHKDGDHAQHDESGQTDMEKMKVELAKLSPEDAASAQKQHICPVSGEMLGAMGAPIKVDVNGQQVWICCEGCKDDLLKSPEEYLAKLKN